MRCRIEKKVCGRTSALDLAALGLVPLLCLAALFLAAPSEALGADAALAGDAAPVETPVSDGAPGETPASDGAPVVAFVAGHGEPSISTEFVGVADALRSSYDVREVDLSRGDSALAEATVAVVAGAPDIPDVELYQLDQFLMRGGRVAFLLDAAEIPTDGLQANVSEGNIFSFVEAYGVTVRPDLVLDRSCSGSVAWNAVETEDPYPYWPLVAEPQINGEHPATAGVETLAFAWTSSIGLELMMPGGTDTSVLARSSGESWTVMAFADLDPEQRFAPDGKRALVELEGGGFPLAVAVSGTFDSAFRGQRLIVERDGRAVVTVPPGLIESSAPTAIVVVGSSMMFRDDLVDRLPGSAAFFRGVIDWLARGEVVDARAAGADAGAGPVRPVSVVAAVLVVFIAVAARRRRTAKTGEARGPHGPQDPAP